MQRRIWSEQKSSKYFNLSQFILNIGLDRRIIDGHFKSSGCRLSGAMKLDVRAAVDLDADGQETFHRALLLLAVHNSSAPLRCPPSSLPRQAPRPRTLSSNCTSRSNPTWMGCVSWSKRRNFGSKRPTRDKKFSDGRKTKWMEYAAPKGGAGRRYYTGLDGVGKQQYHCADQ